VPTAPASTGDPRMLELKLKEQLQGLAPACGRRMWLGSAASDMRERDATSPAMFCTPTQWSPDSLTRRPCV